LGIFNAGCLFQQRRKQNVRRLFWDASVPNSFLVLQLGTRSCRWRDSSHTVPYIHALRCKKCHDHKCFGHLLTSGIHSAEAILSQQKDDQHEDWHRRHSKVEIDRVKSEALRAEQSGVRLDLRHQLNNVASTFPICNPVKFSLVKLGWYDQVFVVFLLLCGEFYLTNAHSYGRTNRIPPLLSLYLPARAHCRL
jgi:hypothetical protein